MLPHLSGETKRSSLRINATRVEALTHGPRKEGATVTDARGQERLKEAAKLGFSVALVPKANAPKRPIEGLTVHPVDRVDEAMDVVRGL